MGRSTPELLADLFAACAEREAALKASLFTVPAACLLPASFDGFSNSEIFENTVSPYNADTNKPVGRLLTYINQLITNNTLPADEYNPYSTGDDRFVRPDTLEPFDDINELFECVGADTRAIDPEGNLYLSDNYSPPMPPLRGGSGDVDLNDATCHMLLLLKAMLNEIYVLQRVVEEEPDSPMYKDNLEFGESNSSYSAAYSDALVGVDSAKVSFTKYTQQNAWQKHVEGPPGVHSYTYNANVDRDATSEWDLTALPVTYVVQRSRMAVFHYAVLDVDYEGSGTPPTVSEFTVSAPVATVEINGLTVLTQTNLTMQVAPVDTGEGLTYTTMGATQGVHFSLGGSSPIEKSQSTASFPFPTLVGAFAECDVFVYRNIGQVTLYLDLDISATLVRIS